jgi:FkbM family methyltransferase
VLLKRLISFLPLGIQQEFRRLKIHMDIRRGRFRANDPEYEQLPLFVKPGDWVIDVGANVGYYTWRLSQLVGQQGRVLAIEPIPESMEMLMSVIGTLPYDNVTTFNVAASDQPGIIHFSVPKSEDHSLPDYFMARACADGGRSIYACSVDQIAPPHKVSFVKIDTEGHEYQVVQGMQKLIGRDRPVIVVEGEEDCDAVRFLVGKMGYVANPKAGKSANILLKPANGDGREATPGR